MEVLKPPNIPRFISIHSEIIEFIAPQKWLVKFEWNFAVVNFSLLVCYVSHDKLRFETNFGCVTVPRNLVCRKLKDNHTNYIAWKLTHDKENKSQIEIMYVYLKRNSIALKLFVDRQNH